MSARPPGCITVFVVGYKSDLGDAATHQPSIDDYQRDRERQRERGFHQKILHSKSRPDHDAWGPRNPSCFTFETCFVVLHWLCVRACGQTG